MTSTLTPTCAFCGLRFDSRPLLELHVREDHAHLDRPARSRSGRPRRPHFQAAAYRPIRAWPVSRTFPHPGASHREERATDPPAAYRAGDGRPAPGGWCLPARQRGTTAGVGCHAAPGGRTAALAPGRHARRAERSVDGRQRPYRPRGMTSRPACLGRPGARRRRIAYPVAAPASSWRLPRRRRCRPRTRHALAARHLAGRHRRRRSIAVLHLASSAAVPAVHSFRPDWSYPGRRRRRTCQTASPKPIPVTKRNKRKQPTSVTSLL